MRDEKDGIKTEAVRHARASSGRRQDLAALLARGVMRALAKHQAKPGTTCLSATTKPCLVAVNSAKGNDYAREHSDPDQPPETNVRR